MRRTLPGAAVAVLASVTLLAGCGAEEGGSNVGPAIDDPAVTEGATAEPGAGTDTADDMSTMEDMEDMEDMATEESTDD